MSTSTAASATPSRLRDPVSRYVAGWALVGIVAAAALAVGGALSGVVLPTALALVCVGAVVVADATELRFDRGAVGEYVTVVEVGTVVTLLVLPIAYAPMIVASGFVVHHGLIRRRPLLKVAFNAGQHTVSAAVAAPLVAMFHRPGDPVGTRTIVGVLLGMSAYALVNSVAIGGLFARLEQTDAWRILKSRLVLMVSTLLGASVIGILVVGLWQANAVLVPLLVSPVAALHLAYRGTARTETLLQEVRIERDRLDRVLAGASEGIVLLGADGDVQLWNPAMEAITGYRSDDVVGRSAAAALRGVGADGVWIDPLMPLHQGRGGTFEIELPMADGERTVVALTHTLITDDDGEPLGDVVLVRDLARERAAKSLKEDFVARVSHELRTPLSPIRGYAQTLLMAGERVTAEQRDDVLGRIVERTNHLERLVDDLLLVSKISSGLGEEVEDVTCETVDVDQLTRRIVSWFERDHRDREFVLRTPGRTMSWCDPLRTGQVLTNLLSNACKYSAPGAPVEVVLSTTDDHVEVAVHDRGAGIPADQLEIIFERFQRLDDPQRMRTGGIGLGLWIARHLAERMRGSLTVASRRGHGSVFTLSLPRDVKGESAVVDDGDVGEGTSTADSAPTPVAVH